ncbi:hypothetical protein Tco_1033785, partial [Tanacetum coccineum]
AVKDSADADVSSLLDIPIKHETPQIQSPSVQKIPVSVISITPRQGGNTRRKQEWISSQHMVSI